MHSNNFMKVFILSSILILFIITIFGISDASAQIQVSVTPYKEPYHIDEYNYATVKVSKIVPNTNFCTQYIVDETVVRSSNHNAHFNEKLSDGMIENSERIRIDWNEPGDFVFKVFYGQCNDENSFGTDSVNLFLNKEPSNIAKFIQDNYFPEKIDVGATLLKNDSFSYSNCFSALNRNAEIITCTDSNVSQNWSQREDGSGENIKIKIHHINNEFEISEEFRSISIVQYPKLECFESSRSAMYSQGCLIDNVLVNIIHYTAYVDDKVDSRVFLLSSISKIMSNPIPSQSKLVSMHPALSTTNSASSVDTPSITYHYTSTHIENFPDSTKSPQHYLDRYNNEESYKEWFDSQFPNNTIHEILDVTEPQKPKIPSWVNDTMQWYLDGVISEDEMITAIQYLVKEGIIDIS